MTTIGRISRSFKLQKKKIGNIDTVGNDCTSLKSEGIYVWPSWQRSLTSRKTNRPAANRGIFRGEFILLRSSPPGTVSMKSRKMTSPNRNGHLYAQRNRPCPISLPLQKHEYPTRINQMDAEDELNTDDIERMFKQPLDIIPEYGNMVSRSQLYQVDEEDEEYSQEVDNDHLSHENLPYTINTLEKYYGLKEAQTSFSVFGGRRPYRRTRNFGFSVLTEDYSSDESGISTESGISSHSDNDDKTGYNPSSSDESGTSKRFSDSCDSALKDSYCMSSDEEDINQTKRKKSDSTLDDIVLINVTNQNESNAEQAVIGDGPIPMSKNSDEPLMHPKYGTKTLSRPMKVSKRPPRCAPRKRSEVVSSSDEEGFGTISSSFMCMTSNRVNMKKTCSDDSQADAKSDTVSPPLNHQNSLLKQIQLTQPDSLASVLQKSMMGVSDLKTTLRSNSMKENTCKTVFNSASLTRDNRKKTLSRQERDAKTSSSRRNSSMRSEVSVCPLRTSTPVSHEEHPDSGSYSSYDEKQLSDHPYSCPDTYSNITIVSNGITTFNEKHNIEYTSNNKENTPPPHIQVRSQSDISSEEEEVSTPHKTADKIKALQSVLMKKSLPFANPMLFKEMKLCKTEEPATEKPEMSTTSDITVAKSSPIPRCNIPLPVPPPPPPPPSSTLPKVKKPTIAKCVSYATTTKVQTEKDDCQLDDATKTRIASIKSMLERASNIDDCSTDRSSVIDCPGSSDTT